MAKWYDRYLNYQFLIIMIILVVLKYIWGVIKEKIDDDDQFNIVQKYLLNDNSLAKPIAKRPFIWIHTVYDLNANKWASFGSRNTLCMNQPYKYMTIKSIIDKCGDDFNVCMIDDKSFAKILPGWSIDLNKVPDPIKTKIRELALAKVLYRYGGMVVPNSFACFENLKPLFDSATQGAGGAFIGETIHERVLFFGSARESVTMREYIEHMERLVSSDYTAESVFQEDGKLWCAKKIEQGAMNFVPGKVLGARDAENRLIGLETLMGNTQVHLDPGVLGVYIPDQAILERTKYQWFASLTIEQALESETLAGNYILFANSQ